MAAKIKKGTRWDMRVPSELDNRVKALAQQIGKSRNRLIEDLAWKAVLDSKAFFECCPECEVPMFSKEELNIGNGIADMECANGHQVKYDFGTNKFT